MCCTDVLVVSKENMHLTVAADAMAVYHVVFEWIDISEGWCNHE